MTLLPPRIEVIDPDAGRLALDLPELPQDPVPPWLGTGYLLLGAALVLVLGLPLAAAVGLVVDQFGRAAWLGWLTLGICALGLGLLMLAVAREISGLRALARVDQVRADLAGTDALRRMRAAREWLDATASDPATIEALRTINDPDAAVALLRAGPGEALRRRTDALGRQAAVQAVAGIAAVPSPALDVLLVGWRGVRLVRQVAALYGVRPGLLATLSLLRRTAMAATLVGGAEVAANAAAHAVLSNPLLTHLAGELAGAGVAARRMLVLARSAATACDPLPPD